MFESLLFCKFFCVLSVLDSGNGEKNGNDTGGIVGGYIYKEMYDFCL